MGSGFLKKKKQAKMFQEQFAQLSKQLESTETIGTSGNGLVTVSLSGTHELKDIKIKPECVDPEDVEGLETLIKAAYNDALQKLQSQSGMPTGLPDLSSFGF